jgi:hypothetical protein
LIPLTLASYGTFRSRFTDKPSNSGQSLIGRFIVEPLTRYGKQWVFLTIAINLRIGTWQVQNLRSAASNAYMRLTAKVVE